MLVCLAAIDAIGLPSPRAADVCSERAAYHGLNVVPIVVPPLRDRKEDILALARLFIKRLAPDANAPPELGSDAVHTLRQHHWPGNVRELRNVIERAMAYAPVPDVLHAEHLRL